MTKVHRGLNCIVFQTFQTNFELRTLLLWGCTEENPVTVANTNHKNPILCFVYSGQVNMNKSCCSRMNMKNVAVWFESEDIVDKYKLYMLTFRMWNENKVIFWVQIVYLEHRLLF